MEAPNRSMQLLRQAPVSRALVSLGLPIMLGMLINALYNLADTYFVSGLGIHPVGAISVAYPLTQAIVGLGLLFGNGAASYLSRLLGRGERQRADCVASTAVFGSLLVGAVVIAGSMLFLEPLLALLGASDQVMPYGLRYASICLPFSLCNVFNVTMNNIVSSEGAAKTTMRVLVTGAVLNVLLDPLCIYRLGLGVAGAAVATALAQGVSTFLYLRYLWKKNSVFQIRLRNCAFSAGVLGEILKIGVPTLVFQLLTSLSVALINGQAGDYGDAALAAMGVVTKVMSIGSLMVFGFLKGLQPIAGYSYGAQDYPRLRQAVRLSTLWSTVACGLFGVTVALAAPVLMRQFTQGDWEMLRVGSVALRAWGLSFCIFGFYTVYSSLFLALGKARRGFLLGACRQGICFVPILFAFSALWQFNGVLFAQPAADVASGAVAALWSLRFRKELREREGR